MRSQSRSWYVRFLGQGSQRRRQHSSGANKKYRRRAFLEALESRQVLTAPLPPEVPEFPVPLPDNPGAHLRAGWLFISAAHSTEHNNQLTISRDELGNIYLRDEQLTWEGTGGIAGAELSPDGRTLIVPQGAITGQQIFVNGGEGNDNLTVDFSGGNPIPLGGLKFNGGGQTSETGDEITLAGGEVDNVDYIFINENDGSVTVDGRTLDYVGLEPITDTLAAGNRTLTYTGGAETITIDDNVAGDGLTRINSTLGELVNITPPAAALTIVTSVGDVTTINSFDAGFNTPLLSLQSTGGASNFNLGAANVIPDTTGLSLAGDATFSLNGFSERVASLASADATSKIILSAGQTLTVGDATDTTFAGEFATGSTGGLTKVGTGTLILSGVSGNYSGPTTINGGVLQIAQASASGTGPTIINSGGVFEINNFTHDGPVALNNGGTLRGIGAAARENGVVTIAAGGAVTLAATAGSTLTLSDAANEVTGGAGTAISIDGGGIVALTQNSNAGTAANPVRWNVIGGSSLQISADGQFGTVPSPTVANFLTLNNGTLRNATTASITMNAARGITLGAGGATVNNTTTTNITYAGLISGTFPLNVVGTTGAAGGALILSGAAVNQFTSLNIDNSEVFLSNASTANALGTGPINITNNGQFNYLNSASSITIPNAINMASGTTIASRAIGGNSLTLSGVVTLPTSGTVRFDTESTANGPINMTNPANAVVLTGNLTIQVGPTAGTEARVNLNHIFSGTGGLIKTSTGAVQLTRQSTYTGSTTVTQGTMLIGTDDALPVTSPLTVGTGTTVGTLNLQTFNQTVGSLSSTNNAAGFNTITVGPGRTFTVNGNVVLSNNTDGAQTNMNIDGGGSFVANGTTFFVGNNTTAATSKARLNLSALASVDVTMSTSIIVQADGDNGPTDFAILTLSNTANTLTAPTITVGGSATGALNQLILGDGTNVIRANTFNIGIGSRDAGSVTFNSAAGTVNMRNVAGTGATTFNLGTGSATTGLGAANLFDVTGHNADLLLGTVSIGTQPRSFNWSNVFSFDTGTLTMSSLTMATRTQTAESTNGTGIARVTNSTMNLGGGTVTITNGITNLGSITGSAYTDAAKPHTVNATLNITGGNVNIGANSGTSITMATLNVTGTTNVASLSSNAVINVSGGVVTLAGDIVRGAVGGTSTGGLTATAAINLTGGVLNMGGNDVGTLALPIAFTKSTASSASFVGAASYFGPASIADGSLFVNGFIGQTTVDAAATLRPGTGPGVGAGLGIVIGNYVQDGTLAIEITHPSLSRESLDYDQIKVIGGSADIAGATLTVTYTGTAGTFAGNTGQLYTLIDNDGTDPLDTIGTFAGLAEGATIMVDGLAMRISYIGGDGNDVTLSAVAGLPTALYVDDDFPAAGAVDGDLEATGTQNATMGTTAFQTIAAAIAAYPTYSGSIIVNGGTYSAAALAGGTGVTLRLVQDLTNTEVDVTLQNLTGDATDAIVTRHHNVANGNLIVEQGTFSGLIAGSGNVSKTTAGALTLNAPNTYFGSTTIVEGTVNLGVNNALPTTTALIVGTGTTVGTLNLGTFDQTIASLASNSNSTAFNTITVGAGRTLTVNGNVILSNNTDGAETNMNINGGGTLNVTGTNFFVGNNTTAATSKARLNLSTLAAVNLTMTSITVQADGDNGTGDFAILTLSNTANTLIATTLTVGASATGALNQLILGNGTNVIQANTINIGTGSRDAGSVTFASAAGTVSVRNRAGTGRATFNMGTGTANTSAGAANVFNVAGHNADLLLGAVTIGTQPRSTNWSATFSFDTGTLDMTSLTLGTTTQSTESTNGATTARVTNAVLNIGGGTVNIVNGILKIGEVTGQGYTVAARPHTVNATVNITGGTVSIGATSGVSITMSTLNVTGTTNVANLASNAVLNISGGTTTLAGTIVRGVVGGTTTGTMTTSSVVNVAGGTLNMAGQTIGTAAQPIDVTFTSGTIQALGQLNEGGVLIKTGAGTGTISGTNAYTGPTTVTTGTLAVTGTIVSQPTVQTGATLTGTGTTGLMTVDAGGIHAPGTNVGTTTVTGNYVQNGTLNIQIGSPSGTVAGTDYDQVAVTSTGSVNISGATLNVTYTGTPGTFNPTGGSSYVIINNDGTAPGDTVGTFTGLAEGATVTVDGRALTISYVGGDGNDVVLTTAAATVLYVDDDFPVSGTVDGDLETAGMQSAVVGTTAFASIAAALAANPGYSGVIVVNGGVYTGGALLAGGGNVTLQLVQDLANAEPNVTFNDLSGDAGDAIITRFHNAANANLIVTQGSFSGVISGSGDLTKTTAGTLTLSGANTYTGVTAFAGGILNSATIADYGVPSSVGARTLAQETATGDGIGFVFRGGTLQYTGATPQSTNRQIRVQTTGGTIDASGSVPTATLTFSHSGANINWFDTPGARTLTLTGTNTGANTFAQLITDQATNATNVTKAGAGTWRLTNTASTYTGITAFNGGVLNAATITDYGVPSSLGARLLAQETATGDGIGFVFRGGTLQYTGATAQTTNRQIRVQTTGGTIDASGSVPAATLTFSHSGANINWFDTGGVRTFTLTGTNTGANTFAQLITDQSTNATSVTKSGAGTWRLTNPASTYTGITAFNGGVLNAATIADYGVPSSLGARLLAQETATGDGIGLVFRGGTLQYTGATPQTTNRQIRVQTTGATIDASGSIPTATVTFSHSGANINWFDTPGVRTLTLTGTNTGVNTFAHVIANQATNATSVSKTGAGTWSLTNTSPYTGATTVAAGTLAVNGSIAASGTTVQSSATLSGTGTTGPLTVNTGGSHAPGNIVGTTTVTGNYVENGALAIQIGSPSGAVPGTDYDQVRVIGSGSVAIGAAATLTVTYTGAAGTFAPAGGPEYVLIDNDGTAPADTSGTFAGLPAGTVIVVDGRNMTLQYNGGDGNDVVLLAPAAMALYVDDDFPATGTVDGDLETAGTQSAVMGVSAFQSVGAALAANPGYAGVIVVNGGVYTGGAMLAGGGNVTLRLVQDLANGEPNVTFNNLSGDAGDQIITRFHGTANANLIVTTGSFGGEISGSGNVVKSGSGTVTLSGANTYSGTTDVLAGVLTITNPSALGTTAGATTVASGGQLRLSGGIVVAGESVTINGPATDNLGALNNLSGNNEWAGPIVIGNAATNNRVGATAGNLTLSGPISGGQAGVNGGLTVRNGAGVTIVSGGANTYLGDTTVVVGTLRLAGGANRLPVGSKLAIGNTASVSPAIFDLGGQNQTVAGLYTLNSTMVLEVTNSGAPATLTVDLASGTDTYGGVITSAVNLTKSGAGTLALTTVGGNNSNTYTGTTLVSGGRLHLNKTAGQNAIPGQLDITTGGQVTFGAKNQIADTASVNVSGATSVFNGIGVNAGQLANLQETIANLTVTGGTFQTGSGGNWNITGTGSFTGGAGNTIFLGNSNSEITFGSLVLTNMTASPGGTVATNNSFAIYGSGPAVGTVTVGSGGLVLNGSVFNLRRGAAGSRLVLNGDVTATGTSSIIVDPGSGSGGIAEVQLSGTAGAANRTFDVTAGGTLTVSALIADGAATPGSLTKSGVGTLVLSGANTYTGTTNVNAGVLQLSGGSAIADTAGAVNVGLGGTLQLLASETVSSYSGAGDNVGSNDSTLALGAFTLTTTGSAAIAEVTGSAGAALVAGGSITDADDDNNITSPNITLTAATGIGTSSDPIETTVANLEASGGSGGVFLANIGDLVIGGIGAMVGVSATGGGINVSTTDNLAMNENVAGPADVTLSAGDNATLTGNVTSGTTITVNIDFASADAAGGVLTLTGTLTAPGGATLNGGADNDTFNLQPQTGAAVTVNGFAPQLTTTGDVLNLDLTGAVNQQLALGSIGSGIWTFAAPLQTVSYTSIEEMNANAPYHLTLDANAAAFGNTGVADEITLRQSGANLIVERTGAATAPDNDDVGVIFQGAIASIQSFTYLGSSDADILTISDAGGLPQFGSTAPSIPDNTNLAGTGSILFDGNGGADDVVFNLTGANASLTYAIGSGSGAAGTEGEVRVTSGALALQAYVVDTELIERIGTGATPGALSVIGDSGANAIAVMGTGANTAVNTAGYTALNFLSSSFSALSIDGLAGADTIELISLGTGSPPITLNGGLGDDTLRVHSLSGNTGPVTLNGNSGSDHFILQSATNTVDGIVGPVIVDGTDGIVGGNDDRLTIVDSGDTTGDTVFVNAVNPATSSDYRVEGITSTGGDDVIFRNIDTLSYTGTSGDDTIDAQFENTTPAHDLAVATLNGWTGGDQFYLFTSDQIGGTAPTPSGTPSGLASITLNGDAPGNPNASDGNDIFGQLPPGIIGTGNPGLAVPDTVRGIRPSASTAIIIDGGQPTAPVGTPGDSAGDVLNLDTSGLPSTSSLVLATLSGQLAGAGIEPLSYGQIEDLNYVTNNQLINLQLGDTLVRATSGPDTIIFSKNPTPAMPNGTRVRLGTLVVDFPMNGKTLTFAGDGNDYVTHSNVTFPMEIHGEGGNDMLFGGTGNDLLIGGLGNDQINASAGDNILFGDNAPTTNDPEPQISTVGGDDILSALGGTDVFYGGGGNDHVSPGEGNDYIHGGEGDDLLDGAQGDDRIYGGGGHDVISGSEGHDLISGGAGNDLLFGRDGNDVLIGGDGVDSLDGGSGDDLLIGANVANQLSTWTSTTNGTTFDSSVYQRTTDNDAALLAVLAAWSSTGNRSGLAATSDDGALDTIYGHTGNDDFKATTGEAQDQSSPFMGSDESF